MSDKVQIPWFFCYHAKKTSGNKEARHLFTSSATVNFSGNYVCIVQETYEVDLTWTKNTRMLQRLIHNKQKYASNDLM
jgi:hypothetical protein